MKKIVSSTEMGRIERIAYDAGASELAYMELAGRAVAQATLEMLEWMDSDIPVVLLCGTGNNAGDAYVAGRLLMEDGHTVYALQLGEASEGSPLLQKQRQLFRGQVLNESDQDRWEWPADALLIDGIFGTGFHGDCEGSYRKLIDRANSCGLPILSIDVPSGLNGSSGELASSVIKAKHTICLGLPKRGCFIGDAWNHVGHLSHGDFGLSQEAVNAAEASAMLLDLTALPALPEIVATRHKYQAGFVQVLAGSRAMPGAGILAAHAALRTGAGLVQLLVPAGLEGHLQGCPPEIVRLAYESSPNQLLQENAALLIGPGLGRSEATQAMILATLAELRQESLLVDADGLNALADTLATPPKAAVLTPHHGEMHRLLGASTKLDFPTLLSGTQDYADAHQVTVVLKGGPTWIFHPGQLPRVCPVGNPGMATAGSGDVLGGIIVALRSQGMTGAHAAELGVYLHGLAGDLAAVECGTRSMMASDITDHLAEAFRWIEAG